MTHLYSEIDQVAHCIDTLFGGSPEGVQLAQRCRDARKEIEAIASTRGLQTVSIAVIGAKNVGKSWLCRYLLCNPADQAKIRSGETGNQATAIATWIGPDAPLEIEPGHETQVFVPGDAMIDLGQPYLLLDLPGYNDTGVENRQAALKAIQGVPLRLLVISSQTLEDESQFAYLKESDGTTILPVIIDHRFPSLRDEGHDDLVQLKERLRRHCPLAQIIDPVVIPHTLHSPGGEEENARRVDEILIPALRSLLSTPAIDPMIARQVALARFKRELANELGKWLAGITPAYEKLVQEEAHLAAKLVGDRTGTDDQLRAGISMKMRMEAVNNTPAILFPYRTLLSLFALTAGAWDRIAFALAGSIPSLALLAFQTARNLGKLEELRNQAKQALKDRMEGIANEQLSGYNAAFLRSLRSHLPPAVRTAEGVTATTRLEGLDEVTEESAKIFAEAVRANALGKGPILLFGGLATLAFFGLGIGPLWAVYREFLQAWNSTFFTAAAAQWITYPAPSGGMIFSTLLLLLIPTAFLALLTMARSAPRRRVSHAIAQVRERHQLLLERLSAANRIRLVSDDPVREAVRTLLDFTKTKTPPPVKGAGSSN